MSQPAPESTDERLVAAALAGDDEAFAALVARHKGRVLGIAARFARHDQELDDVGQEIFIRACRSLRQYRGDAPFTHWLSRIAVRCGYDLLRRTRREREAQVPLDHVDLPAPDVLEPQRAREVLDRALARLAPAERLVVTLLELEEQSVREVAALTGWSESNVKVRAFRARQRLKQILQGMEV